MRNRLRLLTIGILAVAFVLLLRSPAAVSVLADDNCPDVDGDGKVTFSDADVVQSYWNETVPPAPDAPDVNGNGHVDVLDMMAIAIALFTTTDCQDAPAQGKPPFPAAKGDDDISSLGKFAILVAPDFRGLMTAYPGYDGLDRLESPTLTDPHTIIGRSAPHLDGDSSDTGGTAVGTANTMISDSDFSLVPPGFEGPAGSREVHTEVRSLNLTDKLGLGVFVKAGDDAPDQPRSPGEFESQSASGVSGDDFPAESFFDIFVEVVLPDLQTAFPGATLYNSDPLLVVNDRLQRIPPRVVYVHGNTAPVPVYFKDTELGLWEADELFGWLALAGHGADFDAGDGDDVDQFEQFVESELTEMPLPPVGGMAEPPSLAETSAEGSAASADGGGWSATTYAALAGGLAAALALGAGAWYTRRRWLR